MSATSGTLPQPAAVRPERIAFRHLAAWTFGAVTRTISQPTSASATDCRTVASTSCVSLVVIDWIRTGLDPPTPTPPTRTSRVTLRTVWNREAQ